jgi:ribosomal protein L19E
MGDGRKPLHLRIRERGRDQQDRVGAVRARFDNLVLIDDEVLAQARKARGSRGALQIAEAALEERLVGKDRESGGASARKPESPGRSSPG